MLDDVLTVSYLRTWRDPAGVTHSESETVTLDLSDPCEPKTLAAVGLLDRLRIQIGSHERDGVGEAAPRPLEEV